MKLPPYSKYKDSGIEWLGQLPEHWEVKQLRHLGEAIIGLTFDPTDVAEDEGTFVLRASNVSGGRISLNDKLYVNCPVPDRLRTRIGDILICSRSGSRALIGKNTLIDETSADLTFGTFMTVFRSPSSAYLHHVFNSRLIEFQSGAFLTSTINQLTINNLNSFEVPLPPADEQSAIAKHLDRETAKIDVLLEKKRTLIERLQEKRSALISRTVTRGLPPDAARAAGLDPHPKLKPSGIDWLGDVPEHWELEKFSRVVRIREGQVDPETEPYSSMILIAPNHIESGTGRLLGLETAADQAAISGKYFCGVGEVLYSKIRPALAKATLAPEDCLCSADMYPMVPHDSLLSRYLLAILLSSAFTAWSVLEADRVAMPKINRETLNDLLLPLPPTAEQEKILDFLDRATARIDKMLDRVAVAIERLQEYRSALITAAVTGKIDVREIAGRDASETVTEPDKMTE